MATYRWDGHAGRGVSAQVVGERLEQLSAAHGNRLTARVVVDDARPADSPLHRCFEWDDLRAAELYREDQARDVIRSVRVVVEPIDGAERTVTRMFVNVIDQRGGEASQAYVPSAVVRSDEDLRREVLLAARRDFLSWRARYQEIAELVGADVGMDIVLGQLDAAIK